MIDNPNSNLFICKEENLNSKVFLDMYACCVFYIDYTSTNVVVKFYVKKLIIIHNSINMYNNVKHKFNFCSNIIIKGKCIREHLHYIVNNNCPKGQIS